MRFIQLLFLRKFILLFELLFLQMDDKSQRKKERKKKHTQFASTQTSFPNIFTFFDLSTSGQFDLNSELYL